MEIKGAFIFLAPESNKEMEWVKTPQVHLLAIAVNNYAEAVKVAQDLASQGIQAIELCGGFGNKGVAAVAEAVGDKVAVGVVRFDTHPALDGKSGDMLF